MTYKSDNPYIVYSRPSVYQKRNEHDLLDDFNLEVYGYNNTTKFLNKTLDTTNLSLVFLICRYSHR